VSSPKGLIETSRVAWDDAPVTITADEAMSQADPEEASALREAKDWLKEILANGPVSSNDIQRQARALGISAATLRRAQKSLKIRAKKRPGRGGGWDWELKDAQDAQGDLGDLVEEEI
jgi:putative DNA primase/helicase